ncbi:unnamed protein product, partial [Gongylonema pulchrum]|uniref:PAP-associated domain-containing protein n=1 Tax=Gongylonema pulchrum TaxID=637853 RepID=A0A183D056_9BILA
MASVYGLEQPILPSLQVMYPKRFSATADVRSLNVSTHLEPPQNWVTNETTTLGELLIGFLEYYAFKFDYLKDAISVRLGKKIPRLVVARQTSLCSIAQWNCICIEEPFTLSNTAHSVHSQMVFDAIRQAFVDGYNELNRNRDLKAFLDVGPININLTPCSRSSSAQLTETEASDSSTSSEATAITGGKTPELISPQLEKEESFELVDADRPLSFDGDCGDAEAELIESIFPQTILDNVNAKSHCVVSAVGNENEVSDAAVGADSKEEDLIENVVPVEEDESNNASTTAVHVDVSLGIKSGTLMNKSVLSERQPKELQMQSAGR